MIETIMCIKNWVTSKLQKHVAKNIFDNFKNLDIKDKKISINIYRYNNTYKFFE